jgi:integrase/recombinase XerD
MALPAPNAPTAALPVPLTAVQFQHLAAIPPELEWFANLTNLHTRRAYQQDIHDFQAFAGLRRPEQFRDVTRAHVIAWRQQLARHGLANDTIRRKLAALSSLYAYLCDRHAVLHNPVPGVKRPRSMNRNGVTPALGDHQARMLLEAPPAETLKGKRDRAILATLLYHGLRCEELCTLKAGDIPQREGVPHLRAEEKGDKVRYLPLHVLAQRLITAYLGASGHARDLYGPLFRPVKNHRTGTLAKPFWKLTTISMTGSSGRKGTSYVFSPICGRLACYGNWKRRRARALSSCSLAAPSVKVAERASGPLRTFVNTVRFFSRSGVMVLRQCSHMT